MVVGRDVSSAALLVVVAGQLPFVVGVRTAAVWLAAHAAGLAGLALAAPWSPIDLAGAVAFAGFQVFALAAALLVRREASAREELAGTHAELVATQALLADSARAAERTRIARDLHDSLGHHLSALGIQLEVARKLADGPAAEPVARARELVLQLLADVREAVSALRDDDVIDLAGALAALAAAIPTPVVHLSIGDGLALVDPSLGQTLFRCAQEAVTNAVRHARAAEVWIELAADDRGRDSAAILHPLPDVAGHVT